MPINYRNLHFLKLSKQLTNFTINRLPLNDRIKKAFDFYEEVLGIKEVRKTQENVLLVESEFIESSRARRETQNNLILLQEQLKQVRQKLDSTHRSDEAYLTLITKEHQLIKNEMQLLGSLKNQEEEERNLFSRFSQKLRDAHEIERLRQEKTKYLSVIGSIAGAFLGIIATSINHALKRKDFKEIARMIEDQNKYKTDLVQPTTVTNPESEDTQKLATETVAHQTELELKSREQIMEVINLTESNLEYKMKINAVTTVVATYTLIVLTVPLILRLFGN